MYFYQSPFPLVSLVFILFFAVFIHVLRLLSDGTMDPAALVEAIVEEVNCPICMTFLREPVSISCGHTFCHSCLSGLWKLSGESQDWGYTCPLCRAPVQPRKLRPNWQLASVVDKVRLLGFCVEMGLKTDVCTLHKEPLTMFCKEDDVVTCKACNQSPAHEAHSVVPVKDVAWEYKVGNRTWPCQSFLCLSSGCLCIRSLSWRADPLGP